MAMSPADQLHHIDEQLEDLEHMSETTKCQPNPQEEKAKPSNDDLDSGSGKETEQNLVEQFFRLGVCLDKARASRRLADEEIARVTQEIIALTMQVRREDK